MKLLEFIRCIEDYARDDDALVFYSSSEPSYSTEGWGFITGDVGDQRAPFIGYITLSFRASDSGVQLYKDTLLEWLYSVQSNYGNQKIRILLHQGSGNAHQEFLEDNLWGRVETSDGIYFSVSSPPDGPGFMDYAAKAIDEYGLPSF